MKKFLISIFIVLMVLVPMISLAQNNLPELESPNGGIVPCKDDCDFNDFMTLINNVIKFMLFYLALPICAIMFAYAGFLMVTAGESASEARTKAKGIFMNALIGLLIATTCWIVVHSILEVLGYEGGWIGL